MLDTSKLINLLIDADIESFFDREDAEHYLAYLLSNGIKGYESYEYDELLNECIDRNLIEENENA